MTRHSEEGHFKEVKRCRGDLSIEEALQSSQKRRRTCQLTVEQEDPVSAEQDGFLNIVRRHMHSGQFIDLFAKNDARTWMGIVVCASKAGKAAEGTIVAAFKEVMELEESNGVLEAEEYMSMLWHLQQMGLYRQANFCLSKMHRLNVERMAAEVYQSRTSSLSRPSPEPAERPLPSSGECGQRTIADDVEAIQSLGSSTECNSRVRQHRDGSAGDPTAVTFNHSESGPLPTLSKPRGGKSKETRSIERDGNTDVMSNSDDERLMFF